MEMIWVVPQLKRWALRILICRNVKLMLNYYNEQVFHPISTLAQCATIELCQ